MGRQSGSEDCKNHRRGVKDVEQYADIGNDGEYPPAARIAGDVGSAGSWEEVATAVISEATLVEQPRGKEFEYRIIAVNKAGEGEPSNTAMVAL